MAGEDVTVTIWPAPLKGAAVPETHSGAAAKGNARRGAFGFIGVVRLGVSL